jgi:CelD/BcsL family acetyltransferase involved in cellulose biosynthesis
MYEVREHTAIDDLHSLSEAWDELASLRESPGLFGTYEWTAAWWNSHLQEGRTLLVLSVWESGRLMCIAPLMRGRAWFGPFPLSTLEFVSMWNFAGSAASVLGSMDFVLHSEAGGGAIEAVLRYIELKEWDLLRLHPIREDSPSLAVLCRWGDAGGRRFVRRHVFDNAVLRCAEGREGFRSHLTPKFRARLRQAGAKLRRRGVVEFLELTSPDEVRGAFERIIDVERRSWKWKKGIAINSAAFRGFFEAISRQAAAKGWLRIGFLRFNGMEIAYSLMIQKGGTASFLKTGYADGYDDCSPGSLLMDWAFDRRAREGARRIDMFSGDWEYKRRWQAVPESHCEAQVFNRGVYGRLLCVLSRDLGLYGKGRTPVLLLKRVLRRCGIHWRNSELTRSDQL